MAIKVKQDMIDFIKSQGMARALKRAGSLQAKGSKGEAEFIEGVKRMYGTARLTAATSAAKPAVKAASSPDAARKAYASKPMTKKVASSPDAARAAAASLQGKDAKSSIAAGRTPARRAVYGGTAEQRAQAAARAGGNINVNRTTSSTPAKKAPSKPYVAPKPTAQQMAQAKARAGAGANLTPKPKAKPVPETAAQKAAKAALKQKQRKASAAAVKRAGGRTM